MFKESVKPQCRSFKDDLFECRRQKLPTQYVPELKEAAKRANLNWDDFTITDNECLGPDKVELE